MMINVRLRKNKDAETGTVFHIDTKGIPIFEFVVSTEDRGIAEDCTEYGYRVYLQKSVAETGQKKGEGRSAKKLETHLKARDINYSTSEWVATKNQLALIKDLSKEELMELIAQIKAKCE